MTRGRRASQRRAGADGWTLRGIGGRSEGPSRADRLGRCPLNLREKYCNRNKFIPGTKPIYMHEYTIVYVTQVVKLNTVIRFKVNKKNHVKNIKRLRYLKN